MTDVSALHQPIAQSGERVDAAGEQALRARDGAHGAPHTGLRVGDPIPHVLTPNQLRKLLGYSRTHFWRLEKAGSFTHLLVDVGPGVRRHYSGVRFAARLDGSADREDDGQRRYFKTAAVRHAADPTKQLSPAPRKSAIHVTEFVAAPPTPREGEM